MEVCIYTGVLLHCGKKSFVLNYTIRIVSYSSTSAALIISLCPIYGEKEGTHHIYYIVNLALSIYPCENRVLRR